MRPWRVAPSLAAAIVELDRLYPNRSKVSDGTIGDARHAATSSDHNPDPRGVVHAADFTHDPAHGVDCAVLMRHLATVKDHRVRYLIYAGRLIRGPWSASVLRGESVPWISVPYTGPDPHHTHLHVSIGYNRAVEADRSLWWH